MVAMSAGGMRLPFAGIDLAVRPPVRTCSGGNERCRVLGSTVIAAELVTNHPFASATWSMRLAGVRFRLPTAASTASRLVADADRRPRRADLAAARDRSLGSGTARIRRFDFLTR